MSGPWFKNMMTGRGQSSRSSAPQSGNTPPSSPPPHTRYATQPTDQYDLKKPTKSSHMLPQMTQSWAGQGAVSPEPPQAGLAPHQSPESALSPHAQSTPQPLPPSAAPSQPASSHGQRPPAARTTAVANALRTFKRARSALRDTAEELEPLASDLDAFLSAWNGYQVRRLFSRLQRKPNLSSDAARGRGSRRVHRACKQAGGPGQVCSEVHE